MYLYNVALDIRREEQISAMLILLSLIIVFAILTFGLSLRRGFLPPTCPLALAAESPALVRS